MRAPKTRPVVISGEVWIDPWIDEVVIDTGQRYQSEILAGESAALDSAEEMRGRGRVMVATAIQLATGVCRTALGRNVAADREFHGRRRTDREILRELLGG